MKDFLLLVRTEGDHLDTLSPEQQQQHVQKISNYIGDLMQRNKLKDAQPIEQDGVIIYGNKGSFKDGPYNEVKEVIVGYFLIQATDLDEAVEIAKNNPVFDEANASIEVRPIKSMDGIND